MSFEEHFEIGEDCMNGLPQLEKPVPFVYLIIHEKEERPESEPNSSQPLSMSELIEIEDRISPYVRPLAGLGTSNDEDEEHDHDCDNNSKLISMYDPYKVRESKSFTTKSRSPNISRIKIKISKYKK